MKCEMDCKFVNKNLHYLSNRIITKLSDKKYDSVYLNNNKLKKLPKEFCDYNVGHLTYIFLSDNLLIRLPETRLHPSEHVNWFIYRNKIKNLPYSFRHTYLDLNEVKSFDTLCLQHNLLPGNRKLQKCIKRGKFTWIDFIS